jgi:hypothetical protein
MQCERRGQCCPLHLSLNSNQTEKKFQGDFMKMNGEQETQGPLSGMVIPN